MASGGQFALSPDSAGYSIEEAPDREGNQRSAIVFELVPANVSDKLAGAEEQLLEEADLEVDLAGLRARALQAAQSTPQVTGIAACRNLYRRSAAVRRYVLARAAGICV